MTDWKKDPRTPEEQAKEKYFEAVLGNPDGGTNLMLAHIACLRSEVIPRDELIMELVEVCERIRNLADVDADERSVIVRDVLTKARTHGYNTPER